MRGGSKPRIIDRSGYSLKDLSKSVSVGTRKMVNYACSASAWSGTAVPKAAAKRRANGGNPTSFPRRSRPAQRLWTRASTGSGANTAARLTPGNGVGTEWGGTASRAARGDWRALSMLPALLCDVNCLTRQHQPRVLVHRRLVHRASQHPSETDDCHSSELR